MLFFEQRQDQLLGLRQEDLFPVDKERADNDSDKEVQDRAENAEYAFRDRRQNAVITRQQCRLNPVREGTAGLADERFRLHLERIRQMVGAVLQESHHIAYIVRHFLCDDRHAFNELRDDQIQQRTDDEENHRDRDQRRDPLGDADRVIFPADLRPFDLAEPAHTDVIQRADQIGHDQSVYKRHHNIAECRYDLCQFLKTVQDEKERDGCDQHQCSRHAPFEILRLPSVAVHGSSVTYLYIYNIHHQEMIVCDRIRKNTVCSPCFLLFR